MTGKIKNSHVALNAWRYFKQKIPVDHVNAGSLFHFMIMAAHYCQRNVGHVVITTRAPPHQPNSLCYVLFTVLSSLSLIFISCCSYCIATQIPLISLPHAPLVLLKGFSAIFTDLFSAKLGKHTHTERHTNQPVHTSSLGKQRNQSSVNKKFLTCS